MKVVNHVANAVLGAGAKDVTECTTGSPVVSSDVVPFCQLLVKDLKLIMLAEGADTIANVEHVPVSELTLSQHRALRYALRLSFRITADFVRDLNAAAPGLSVGMLPVQTIYAVALHHRARLRAR